MNEAERREEKRVTFIYKFSGTGGVVVTCYRKNKGSLFFWGWYYLSLYYTDRLSFLRSPDIATLFARRETLGKE